MLILLLPPSKGWPWGRVASLLCCHIEGLYRSVFQNFAFWSSRSCFFSAEEARSADAAEKKQELEL
eukprot:NODE_2587_length_462_cov_47.789346_g2141_i0.p3 GENE.NODE_2587_length_462_cov_47.789346_g2141_i0~~NODE_2587_length_462_cov_47.789346_g2141_i0.p3  ORF type:complete len:66 (-),score=3.06 NODE_2587_length_462_cov_47.789346_g2141_i0:3-200(-)